MTRNPRLFEQGDRYDDDGSHEYNSRSLWTDITLRDLFAAFALTGILSELAHPNSAPGGNLKGRVVAKIAFELADDMLAEREKRGEA